MEVLGFRIKNGKWKMENGEFEKTHQ